MLKTILILAFVCICICVGPYLADSQGFVHIATQDYVIETSITTACVIIAAAIFVLYFVIQLVSRFLHLPGGTIRWISQHNQRKAATLQEEAYIAYEEGDFARSLGLIRQSDKTEKLPLKALFVAAKSAFNVGKLEETRELLDTAEKLHKQAKIAINVVRAKLNLRIGNTKAALENLDSLKESYKNRLVCKLYYECYKHDYNIEKINELSDQLVKFKLISDQDAQEIFKQVFEYRLKNASTSEQMHDLYKALTRRDKANYRYMGPYINKLIQLGDISQARSLTLGLLKKSTDPDFLESMSTWDISVPDVLDQLKKLSTDNLIASQVNLPLLKALGNLEFKAGLLDDALNHYKQALELTQSADIYYRLGQIVAAQQKYPEAAAYYNRALAIEDKTRALTVR